MSAEQVNRCPHIWVPGTETWFALAARGVWVEGCAESLGFQDLRAMLATPLLALPPPREWLALTSREAVGGWGEVPVLATYGHRSAPQAVAAQRGWPGAGDHAGLVAQWRTVRALARPRGRMVVTMPAVRARRPSRCAGPA